MKDLSVDVLSKIASYKIGDPKPARTEGAGAFFVVTVS